MHSESPVARPPGGIATTTTAAPLPPRLTSRAGIIAAWDGILGDVSPGDLYPLDAIAADLAAVVYVSPRQSDADQGETAHSRRLKGIMRRVLAVTMASLAVDVRERAAHQAAHQT